MSQNATHTISINGQSFTATPEQLVGIKSLLGVALGWTPAGGAKYYFVTSCGLTGRRLWTNGKFDQMRAAMGNVYQTRAEAREAVEQNKALAKAQAIAAHWGGTPYTSGTRFVPCKDRSGKWDTGAIEFNMGTPFTFASNADCSSFIAQVGSATLDALFVD